MSHLRFSGATTQYQRGVTFGARLPMALQGLLPYMPWCLSNCYDDVLESSASALRSIQLERSRKRAHSHPRSPTGRAEPVPVVKAESPSCALNATAVADGLEQLPAHWLRHFPRGSVSYLQQRHAYMGLKGWGRTRFIIRSGRLLYAPPTAQTGCVLRRTPILAWALLELLERDPAVPDVSISFNCVIIITPTHIQRQRQRHVHVHVPDVSISFNCVAVLEPAPGPAHLRIGLTLHLSSFCIRTRDRPTFSYPEGS